MSIRKLLAALGVLTTLAVLGLQSPAQASEFPGVRHGATPSYLCDFLPRECSTRF